jgi:LemA protein
MTAASFPLLFAGLSAGLIVAIAVGAVIFLFIMWIISIYNGLVVARNQYKNSYSQIDVQLKRRYDLIPNLVESVKGYMAHERGTLEDVIKARNAAFAAGQKAASNPGDPQAMTELGRAESQLGGALGRLIALTEAYPDLKANQNMLALQEELTSTENKIGFARQAYNDSVMKYNNHRQVFPAVMVAAMFGFTEAKLFEIESPDQREGPKVSF